MERNLEKYQLIERSILTTYRKTLWSHFVHAVKKYRLIQAGDKIAVCISGGKDSMLLAKLMQELHRHSEIPFELVFLVMDPGYAPENRRRIEENAALMHVPVTIFESDVFAAADAVSADSPCYLCARMRRGHLYSKAKELGCNKIALGHHFNDVIETVIMSMTYSSEIKTMLPKLHSTNFEGMELIRPLYKVKENDIIKWAKANELEFLQCACKMTAKNADIELMSKRKEIKQLIADIKKQNPEADDNIFRSLHNVNMATIPGWRDRDSGEVHTFLEKY